MPFIPIDLPPGQYRNGTRYQAKGRWFDGTLMRFFNDTQRPVGGWQRQVATALDGVPQDPPVEMDLDGICREIHSWETAGGRGFLGFGTHTDLYAFSIGNLERITPTAFIAGQADTILTTATSGKYGDSIYGILLYGVGQWNLSEQDAADLWHLDNFGNFLVGVFTPGNNDGTPGQMYMWDLVNSVAQPLNQGEVIGGFTIRETAPKAIRGLVVTPERFLVALGADGDIRKVRWSSQENFDIWDPLTDLSPEPNRAGDLQIESVGRIMAGRAAQNETLIWTDGELWALTFIGGTFVYGLNKRGDNCGLISPGAVAQIDSGFAWMGSRNFYFYSGYVRPLDSDVQDFVFSDFNQLQRQKVVAFVNSVFGEVWWHYPSEAAEEPDKYVIWNYRENHWATGDLRRTAGVASQSATKAPVLTDVNGAIYYHETGFQHLDLDNTTILRPFLESGPVEIASGDRVMDILQIIPDERTNLIPPSNVEATLVANLYPTSPDITVGPIDLLNPTPVRIQGRQVRLRLDEITEGDWRVGVMRLDAKPGGLR